MLVHPNISPIAVDLGFMQIYWYSLMYLAGLFAGYILLQYLIKTGKTQIKKEKAEDAIIYTAMGLLIGGRLGYFLFYNPSVLFSDPMHLLRLSSGGMSFHGAFLGITIAALLFSRRNKVPMGEIVNIVALAAPIGIFFGRMGNFINQELWGRVSDVPWAMVFPLDPTRLARHPSQIYEALGEGLLIFIIVFAYSRKPRPEWSIGALFVLSYGFIRFFLEFFREPDVQIGFEWLGLTRGQLLCIPMVIIGLAIFVWAQKQKNIQRN